MGTCATDERARTPRSEAALLLLHEAAAEARRCTDMAAPADDDEEAAAAAARCDEATAQRSMVPGRAAEGVVGQEGWRRAAMRASQLRKRRKSRGT